MRQLSFAEPAARDLDAIIDFIALDNPGAAQKAYRAIVAVAERLTRFPDLGRPGRLPDTREFSVRSLPCTTVYQVGTGTVKIVAVFHTARDLSRALADRGAKLKQGEEEYGAKKPGGHGARRATASSKMR